MRKRILSILLALALCLSLLPTTAWAAEDEEDTSVLLTANEDDTPNGTGTAGDPYQIASAAELRWFRDTVNDGQTNICAKLTSDIDLGGEAWTTIGTSANPYTGTFDGRSHVIKNFNKSSNTGWGLFGSIGAGGVVQALSVSPGEVGSNDDRISQSGLHAYQNAGTIRECVATAEYCSGKLYIDGNFGMIAYQNTGTIEDCYLPANWRTDDFLLDASDGAKAAGMAYENTGGTLEYSTDNTSWSSTAPAKTDAGTYTVWYRVSGGNNYQTCRKAPAFRHGDIRHTLFSR